VLLGIARVARGRRDGIGQFGGTSESFLASLAPLVAFPVVGALLMLLRGSWHEALVDLGLAVCAVLAPAVISYELSRLWGRQANWLRFATAFNWCQWILPILTTILLVVASIAVAAGLGEYGGAAIVFLGVGCYALWLHWFLARHALELGGGRAALLVLAVNVGTGLLLAGPALLVHTT
jgi:hypothetical protein